MSDFQIVQQPVAQIHWYYNLSSLDAMKWNKRMLNSANSRLRYTLSRLLAAQLEVDIKNQLVGLMYE